KIILPAAIPFIMAGIRLAVGLAIIGIIVAEFFTAISGLGGMIVEYANVFATAKLFVPIIVIALVGVVLTELVMWLERRMSRWRPLGGGRVWSPRASAGCGEGGASRAGNSGCSLPRVRGGLESFRILRAPSLSLPRKRGRGRCGTARRSLTRKSFYANGTRSKRTARGTCC